MEKKSFLILLILVAVSLALAFGVCPGETQSQNAKQDPQKASSGSKVPLFLAQMNPLEFVKLNDVIPREIRQLPPIQKGWPNDQLLKDQWYLFSPDDAFGTPGSIGVVAAWKKIKPAPSVVVAVLDSGVNWSHPDLAENIWQNPKEQYNGIDDDGNGYADDVMGWNFVDNNWNPNSEPFLGQEDHGSIVASIIAAVPNNGMGISGIARNVKVMPLKCWGQGLIPSNKSRVPEAIRYAVDQGAKVIVSTHGMNKDDIADWLDSLRYAERKGVLFVQTAPNDPNRNIDELYRPWRAFSNVLIVGGTNRDGSFNGWGSGQTVQICAPSRGIIGVSFSTFPASDGNSFAAPMVAAAAATYLSQVPKLKPAQLIEVLRKTASQHPTLAASTGGGRINMSALFDTLPK